MDGIGLGAPERAGEIRRQQVVLQRIAERDCAMWRHCHDRGELFNDRAVPSDPEMLELFWGLCPASIVHSHAIDLARGGGLVPGAWSASGEACLDREFESCEEWVAAGAECSLIERAGDE
jgi:hypothetical protein